MGGSKLTLVVLVSVLCLAVAVTGCEAGQPKLTIITPVNGAQVQVGQNVAVRISATDNRGLTGIQLWVDGELYHTDREAMGQKSYTIAVSWRPATPGEHILTARAVDSRGNSSDPVRAVVTAVGAGGAPPPAGGAQPSVAGAPTIDYFYSEPVSERPGCYYLHWDFRDATSALMNGQGVTAPGSTEVCPDTTTVYRLEATNNAGTTAQEVVIQVGGAAPAGGGAPPAGGEQPPAGGEEPPPPPPPPPPPAGGEMPVIDYFTSEPSERAGCYYLHWDLHGATAAFLNGQGVTAPDSTEVCPDTTTVYRLEAVNDAGTAAEEVTIEVTEAAPPGQPDLVITELAIQPESPRRGEEATVRVSVYNQGDAVSPALSVQWWATPALVGCSWELDGLPARGGRVLECQYTYASWSTYTTHAIADDDNSVPESEEGNNTRELVVRVQQGEP
jgi:hypothetical protein